MRNSIVRAAVLISAVMTSLVSPRALGAAAKPVVLVVLSYHVGMPWADSVTQGLQDKLGDKAELIINQLDVKRFPPLGREATMLAHFTSRATTCNPQLVITVDDFAYRFVLAHRDVLPPNTPIVFGGVNFWADAQPPGVTGVVEAADLSATLQFMQRLQPHAQRWVVINDQSETGEANYKALAAVLHSFSQREVLWLGDGSFSETEARLAKLNPRQDAVLLLSWNIDKTGLTRSYEEAIARVKAICPAPIYGVWDLYFGKGIVGGALLDGRTHGQEIGILARRVLAGESPNSIPVVTQCHTKLMVDYREVERFGLDSSKVPAGTEIHFRTLSQWQQHSSVVIGVGLVIILQGATISWLVVVVRRRKQARSRLDESEANLRLTLDTIDEAVIVTDTKSRITRINPAAEKLIGITAAEAQEQPLAQILSLVDKKSGEPVALPSLELLKQENTKLQPTRSILKSRAGIESIVTHSLTPMLDDKGVARGIVILLRDITARQQLEEQLYQAQKMESVGQLAGGIAHDFNNILAVIVGHGELLRDQLQEYPAAMEDLRMMLRGAQRATDLVQQILAFSRKTKHEMSPIVLQSVIKDALKFLRSTLPSSIEIAPRISSDLPLILADTTQIHQVVMNLCANAAHAMKDAVNGRLEIRLETIHADAEFAVMHTGLREGEYVRLSVSDTGHGMDEATLKRIFEPFFTTKTQGEGTGLGLSVVHGIVKAHNGGIFVYSRPGEGTIFNIYLPALSIAAAPKGTASPQVPSGNGERILFIDDEPALCTSARRIAENLGYRVTTFSKALSALEHLREHADDYDLVVTDLTMPGSTGLNLAVAAHKIRPDLPVILTTGFAADLSEPTIRNHGISKLLLKPFTTVSLAHALSDALKKTA